MKKRVMAILLSMVMVMSFMPAMAFATDGSQEAPVQKEAVTETPDTDAGTDNVTLRLPAPTNLAWGSRYPHYATYEWDHKNLEEYLDKFQVTAKWENGDENDTSIKYANYDSADFQTFMSQKEDGKYSFSVKAIPKTDSGYTESVEVEMPPVQFYKLNLTVGDGATDAGGSVLLRRGDGAERIDHSRKWIYPTGSEIEFEAVPDVGYLFNGFTKDGAELSIDDKQLSFTLTDNTNVGATFTKSNEKSAVTVEFGNNHAALCTNVADAINLYSGGDNSRYPYNQYGQISASVEDGTKLKIKFPKASASEFDVYDYFNDVLTAYIGNNLSGTSNRYIDNNEALFSTSMAVGKNNISQYKSEDDIEKERDAAEENELGATLSLNVLWAQKATSGTFTVKKPLCKSKIEKVRNEDSEYGYTYYTQTNPPEVSVNEGSHFELYGGQNSEGSAANWYNTKEIPGTLRLDDYWYEGTVEAGKKYIAGVLIAPKFGYYVDNGTNLRFEVNGEQVSSPNLNIVPLLLADVEAVHDWDEGTVTKKPTATAEGIRTYKCKNYDTCGGIKTEAIPRLTPAISTTARTSSRSMIVKWTWGKVKGAKKYKIAYRKAGSNKWKIKKTKKTKKRYVVRGQKLKGLYEYKVAAVTNTGDIWSNVSYRYFKGVKAGAKAGKESINVSWKKDNSASGYEVLVANNMKMKNAKKFKVASSKKSYKVTGLKSGKTYYVRVRPMKNHKGITYRGVLCKARKATIK